MVSGWISTNQLPHLKPSKESLIAFVDRMSEKKQLRAEDREPPLEGGNMQKSPEVPATLQGEYVGILLTDCSQVIMKTETYEYMISDEFFNKGGKRMQRADTFRPIFSGTKKDVESKLKAALVAEKERKKKEAEEAKSAAWLKTLLNIPQSCKEISNGPLQRENACVFELGSFRSELRGEKPAA
jgi:hypothetical protein